MTIKTYEHRGVRGYDVAEAGFVVVETTRNQFCHTRVDRIRSRIL